MEVILDSDFGDLHFERVWLGSCDATLFGECAKTKLIIQTFDGEPISYVQRLAFKEFCEHKAAICLAVEQSMYRHYLCMLEDYRACFSPQEVDARAPVVHDSSGMKRLVSLRCIKVMAAFEPELRQIGFIFDATFDPQFGLGVLVTNGAVEAVDVQDILLG